MLSKSHYISFPPNWVHSLDGSLCRIICYIYYKLYSFILEPLHDSFRINFCQIGRLNNVIKYIYLYYFFNKSFHKYRFGITKGILVRNSSNYISHKKLFPSNFCGNSNILEYTFLSCLDLNIDSEKEIKYYIKKNINYSSVDNDINLDKFLSSEFMFYF